MVRAKGGSVDFFRESTIGGIRRDETGSPAFVVDKGRGQDEGEGRCVRAQDEGGVYKRADREGLAQMEGVRAREPKRQKDWLTMCAPPRAHFGGVFT